MGKENTLVTPCCGTEIVPAAGFQSIKCCGQDFDRKELEEQSENQ